MSREAPAYPEGRALLSGKTVVVTAAAGTGSLGRRGGACAVGRGRW